MSLVRTHSDRDALDRFKCSSGAEQGGIAQQESVAAAEVLVQDAWHFELHGLDEDRVHGFATHGHCVLLAPQSDAPENAAV